MTPEVSRLIIQHLCYYNDTLAGQVYYGNPSELPNNHNYKVVIVPARAFVVGKKESMPTAPLKRIENTPLLFGEAITQQQGDLLITHADIIASTFFLVSRYEELLNADRDKHGRFQAKSSIIYNEGFIMRPVVDEYAFILLGWLQTMGAKVEMPTEEFQHIALTHDIDILTAHRRLRGALGSLCFGKSDIKEIINSLKSIENDPIFCFQWLWQKDTIVNNATSINFVMAQGYYGHRNDYPLYQLNSNDIRYFFNKAKAYQVEIGLHGSYLCGTKPQKLKKELTRLAQAYGEAITTHRHHFLTLPEPEADYCYSDYGITDDYSVGFADIAGFRLGTCRPIKRISPLSQKIFNDTLHPLIIMDVTLTEPHYMHLDEAQSKATIANVVNSVRKYHGELVTLWHNTSMLNPIHQRLYTFLINNII